MIAIQSNMQMSPRRAGLVRTVNQLRRECGLRVLTGLEARDTGFVALFEMGMELVERAKKAKTLWDLQERA